MCTFTHTHTLINKKIIIIFMLQFTVFKNEWCQLAESIILISGRKSFCQMCIKELRQYSGKVKQLNEIIACLIGLDDQQFESKFCNNI